MRTPSDVVQKRICCSMAHLFYTAQRPFVGADGPLLAGLVLNEFGSGGDVVGQWRISAGRRAAASVKKAAKMAAMEVRNCIWSEMRLELATPSAALRASSLLEKLRRRVLSLFESVLPAIGPSWPSASGGVSPLLPDDRRSREARDWLRASAAYAGLDGVSIATWSSAVSARLEICVASRSIP